MAANRVGAGVWVGAERTETRGAIGRADHGVRAVLVHSVEGRGLQHIEGAAVRVGVIRVIEPEADMEGVGRRKRDIGIEAEYLIEQDGLDLCIVDVAVAVGLQVRLKPGEAKAGKGRVNGSVRAKLAALGRE